MAFSSESENPKTHDAAAQPAAGQGAAVGEPVATLRQEEGDPAAQASLAGGVVSGGESPAQRPAEGHAAAQTSLQELGEDALAPAADMPIRLPTFEGPLDLLLFLIRRNEIDIYDIPIESVTRQYMQVLHSMEALDLEVAGDFFVMAATLMYIKSRMLLPTNEQVAQPQEEEEEADPRWELVQQLLEYKKYKEAAFELQSLVERRQDFLERYYQQEQISEVERELEPADKIELWNTFNKVLRRLSDRIVKGEIQDEEVSISQRMEYILDTIKVRESFRFTELLEGKRLTVAFLVSTFLAILELTRLKRLYITQDAVYGEIECLRRDNPEDEGAEISEAEREEAMAPRRAARERKAAALAAAAAAKAGVAVGNTTTGETVAEDEDDGFVAGEDDFNWADFGGKPGATKDATADESDDADADDPDGDHGGVDDDTLDDDREGADDSDDDALEGDEWYKGDLDPEDEDAAERTDNAADDGDNAAVDWDSTADAGGAARKEADSNASAEEDDDLDWDEDSDDDDPDDWDDDDSEEDPED